MFGCCSGFVATQHPRCDSWRTFLRIEFLTALRTEARLGRSSGSVIWDLAAAGEGFGSAEGRHQHREGRGVSELKQNKSSSSLSPCCT